MPWLSWHVFRHTHATLGEPMGHGDVRMTLHYTHGDLERRRADIETMTCKLLGEALNASKLAHSDTK